MGNDTLLFSLVTNIIAAVLFLILTSIANTSLGSSPAKKGRPFIGPLTLVVFTSSFVWFVLIGKGSASTVLVNPQREVASLATLPIPELAFFPPSAWTPTYTPTYTPSATPSLTPSSTPTATDTATPTWSPYPTATATIETNYGSTNIPTATSSPTNTPTPRPPIEITTRSETCKDDNFNARITDAVIEIVTATDLTQAAYVTLYGVATRSDFKEYRIYWSKAASSGQSVEAAPDDVFEFYDHKEAPGKTVYPPIQTRPLSELVRPSDYRVTLRVFGTDDGQYQECQVTVRLR